MCVRHDATHGELVSRCCVHNQDCMADETSFSISCIHSYLVLRLLPDFNTFISRNCRCCSQPQACRKCSHEVLPPLSRGRDHFTLPVGSGQEQSRPANDRCERSDGDEEASKSLVRAFNVEERARESSEFQTSGFNTPRRSAETLGDVVGISGGHTVDWRKMDSLV